MKEGGAGSALSVVVAQVPQNMVLKLGFAFFLVEQAVFSCSDMVFLSLHMRSFIIRFKEDVSCVVHKKVS